MGGGGEVRGYDCAEPASFSWPARRSSRSCASCMCRAIRCARWWGRAPFEREHQPRPRIGQWKAELDRLLASNENKAARERLTLIQLFEELRGLGRTRRWPMPGHIAIPSSATRTSGRPSRPSAAVWAYAGRFDGFHAVAASVSKDVPDPLRQQQVLGDSQCRGTPGRDQGLCRSDRAAPRRQDGR